jgi:hypothetical protein
MIEPELKKGTGVFLLFPVRVSPSLPRSKELQQSEGQQS